MFLLWSRISVIVCAIVHTTIEQLQLHVRLCGGEVSRAQTECLITTGNNRDQITMQMQILETTPLPWFWETINLLRNQVVDIKVICGVKILHLILICLVNGADIKVGAVSSSKFEGLDHKCFCEKLLSLLSLSHIHIIDYKRAIWYVGKCIKILC